MRSSRSFYIAYIEIAHVRTLDCRPSTRVKSTLLSRTNVHYTQYTCSVIMGNQSASYTIYVYTCAVYSLYMYTFQDLVTITSIFTYTRNRNIFILCIRLTDLAINFNGGYFPGFHTSRLIHAFWGHAITISHIKSAYKL